MKKRPKFIARETREIIAANVKRLMEQQFAHSTNKPAALAKRIGTSESTVQRVLSGDVGITVDVLAQVANGLRCEPADLLRSPN